MPGAQVQLSVYGQEDAFLTGKPTHTMFKAVYDRKSAFAKEAIQVQFDQTFDFGRMPTASFPRGGGDLLGAVWLEVTLPDLLAYDITPTPSEGNSVDVTTLSGNVYTDTSGNYWQVRNGSPGSYSYANAIALHDGVGNYYASGTPGNTSSYSGNISTWPYMCVADTGNAAIRNFSVPTTGLRWVNGIGMALVKGVELQLGGHRLDKHYSEFWDVWSELTEKEEKLQGFNTMVGKYSDYTSGWRREHSKSKTLYVPMRFCYNRNPGLYLPIAALPLSGIKMNFELRPYLECIKATVPVSSLTSKTASLPLSISDAKLYADYVFLDGPERLKVISRPHEYLVTQLQFQGDEPVPSPQDPNGTVNRKYTLTFSHPVRELVWVYQAASNYAVDATTGNDIFNYDIPPTANTGGDTEIFKSVQLMINGSARFSQRSGSFFRLVEPYEHHTRVPSKSIHVYTFGDGDVEGLQPTGHANFSKFDSAEMSFQLNPNLPAGRLKMYAVSHNILRVVDSLGGLMFA